MRLKAPKGIKWPVAERRDHSQTNHNKTHIDPYYWLKDPGYPDVTDADILGYLGEENRYFEAVMGAHKGLTDQLFEEVKGRIKEDDESVPWREGVYDYRWAFQKGAQYKSWYRRPVAQPDGAASASRAGWDLILDEAIEAEGQEFFKLGTINISPNGRLIAFSADTSGGERFSIYVRDIKTGENISGSITATSGEIVWSTDSKSLFYVEVSEEWRPYRVMQQDLNGQARNIYEESDTSFFIHISETGSQQYLVIRSADHVTAENHIMPLSGSQTDPTCILPRSTGHDYSVDHGTQGFIARSNKDQENFSLYRLDIGDDPDDWSRVRAGSPSRYIKGFETFETFMAVEERIDGLDQILIWPNGTEPYHISWPESAYEAGIANNPEFSQTHLRVAYSSMVTQPSVFDFDLTEKQLLLRKEQEIPSGYDKSNYITERLLVNARDGVSIPVSLVYHKDWKRGSGAPLHLYGYGAYGLGMAPAFSSARLSLLDRGFVYAIAHIRGGDELGYGWYQAGKLEQRENTFNDFVDVARALIETGYAGPGDISISGGSAGGELMGAVLNQAPELFKAAVLHVPFVDVLNTMLDASLPLTPIEWPEWGNPIEDEAAYDLIRSYCPYTNIAAKDYPPMMVTGGINDPRVTYWEPAKWTAKMRTTKTDDNLLVMKINMEAGHGGKSGRFERLREVAEEYTFLMMAFGLADNQQ